MSGGDVRAGDVRIRPDTAYAWCGPALLITNCRGECTDDLTLTGFYFRETRFLATLRLEVDGECPWLCEIATPEPDRIELLLLYPEMESFGGGGSGQSGDEVLRNERGLPYRALNLQLSYRVTPSGLDVELIASNHAPETVRCEVAWALDTDFADLQEAHALQPVAPFELLVVDPALPSWLPEVVLHGLRLGRATFTLRCWRDTKGDSHAEIVEKKGTVRLLRQPPPESLSAGVTDRIRGLVETLRHH